MVKKIYLMTKLPFKGFFKTRLSKEIGFLESRRLTLNNIEKIYKIFSGKRYSLNLYVFPKKRFRTFSITFSKNLILQKGSDLGKKIWDLYNVNEKSFVLFGSDIPEIEANIINSAFNLLKTNDIVIGPSKDGGFWLIGFSYKRKISFPFKKVRWSTNNTLNDFTTNLDMLKIRYAFSKKLTDIDNLKDYCDYIKSLS